MPFLLPIFFLKVEIRKPVAKILKVIRQNQEKAKKRRRKLKTQEKNQNSRKKLKTLGKTQNSREKLNFLALVGSLQIRNLSKK